MQFGVIAAGLLLYGPATLPAQTSHMGPKASQKGSSKGLAGFNEGSAFLRQGGLLAWAAQPYPQPQGLNSSTS